MASFQDQVQKDNIMPVEAAEIVFSKPMVKLYQSLITILNENKVIAAEYSQPLQQQKTIKMIGSIIKVQNQLVKHGQNHPHISHVLGDMAKQIKDTIGGVISPDSENLVKQVKGNFETIDKNVTTFK
jgi:hypothetical protein